MEIFGEAIRFLIVLLSTVWVPGLIFVWLFDRDRTLSPLEQLVVALVCGIAISTGVGIAFDIFGVSFSLIPLMVTYGLFLMAFAFLARKRCSISSQQALGMRERYPVALVVVLTITLLLKVWYLADNTIPISTDLGHHMYWSQSLVEKGELPTYVESDIVMGREGERHSLSDPQPISDVIIGEHVIFAHIALLSQTKIISVYPIIFIFVVHVVTLIGVYILTRRLFSPSQYREAIAVTALIIAGILFGLDSPQMKYVIGGVVGNTFGNLFIVSIFLALAIAVKEHSRSLMALAVFLMIALAYTHHLSTLLLAFSLVGVFVMYLVFRPKLLLGEIMHLVLSRQALITAIIGATCFFLIWTPSYIANRAVETVVGDPEEKVEHAGISLMDYMYVLGEERIFFALLGTAILLVMVGVIRFSHRDKSKGQDLEALFLIGWAWPLLLLVLYPSFLGISIPTVRTANYSIFPMAILGAYFFVSFLVRMGRTRNTGMLFGASVVMFVVMLMVSGWRDNGSFLSLNTDQSKAKELHRSAIYLATHFQNPDEVVMYDHINIEGGSWIKLYFLRDYNYPFYRAHLFRYERSTDRQERCTLYVVSDPSSLEAEKCFRDLNIRAIVVNDIEDGKAFREDERFSKVFSANSLAIYTYQSVDL